MTAKGFDILKDIEGLERTMAKFIEGAWRSWGPSLHLEKSWRPPLDVIETPKEIVIVMEIAGARKEDITVSLEGDILRIAGQRQPPGDIDPTRLHQIELDFGEFERNLRLPGPLSQKKVAATYKDGFLRIVIPKEARREKVIEIEEK